MTSVCVITAMSCCCRVGSWVCCTRTSTLPGILVAIEIEGPVGLTCCRGRGRGSSRARCRSENGAGSGSAEHRGAEFGVLGEVQSSWWLRGVLAALVCSDPTHLLHAHDEVRNSVVTCKPK